MLSKFKSIAHFLLAYAAYFFYGRPSRKLIVVGVTGTKGKSTTCRLIASVLEAGGNKVGLLSTVEFQIGSERTPNKKQMTMLGRGEIQKMLRRMVQAGCAYAVIETSSEGILQYRHIGLAYDIAVFTNLGTEHHERHGGFENLRRDKGKLFAGLAHRPAKTVNGERVPTVIIANGDDEQAGYFLHFSAMSKWVYGLLPNQVETVMNNLPSIKDSKHNLVAKRMVVTDKGTDFLVGTHNFHLNIFGTFNVPNALAAIAVGEARGISAEKIALGLASVTGVAGRMEFISSSQPFKVVVDYAHEPMSLTALFTALRACTTAPGKLVAVVGSDGGGRDKQKRARMGEIAGELCDIVVISDVNPWDEDPEAIAEMLASGARKAGKISGQDLFVVINRKEGIRKAFSLAGQGGVVAITAKGTESSIISKGGVRLPWDDREVARELLFALTQQ